MSPSRKPPALKPCEVVRIAPKPLAAIIRQPGLTVEEFLKLR